MRLLKNGERATAEVLNRPHIDAGGIKGFKEDFDSIVPSKNSFNFGFTGSDLNIQIDGKKEGKSYFLDNITLPMVTNDNFVIQDTFISSGDYEAGSTIFVPKSRFKEVKRFLDPNATSDDSYAKSVKVYENILIVGANQTDINGKSNVGRVYVYNISYGGYELIQIIENPDEEESAQFGFSVDFDGSRLVVGAQLAFSTTNNATGKVYVYSYTETGGFNYDFTINSPLDENLHNFGSAVSLYNNKLIVGAKQDGVTDSGGRVYVFSWDGSQYNLDQTLIPNDNQPIDNFGVAAKAYGDYLYVGASKKEINGISSKGKLYVYKWDGSQYNELTSFYSDENVGESYAYGLEVYEEYVFVGAVNNNFGKIYMYKNDNENYIKVSELTHENTSGNTGFGRYISIYNNKMFVGSKDQETPSNGILYEYQWLDSLRLLKENVTSNTVIDDANSVQANIKKEYTLFLEYYLEKVDEGYVYEGGFVQSTSTKPSVNTDSNDSIEFIKGQPLQAQKMEFDALSDQDRMDIAKNSILLREGLDTYQVRFKFRAEPSDKNTKLSDYKANGTGYEQGYFELDRVQNGVEIYKYNDIYAIELAKISL